jgi:hypothetical protein
MSAKRFKPRDIWTALLSNEDERDSEFVRAKDYDALQAEIERLRDELRQSSIDTTRAEVERLRAERDALRADAERYRYLRDMDGMYDWRETVFGSMDGNLDTAVDAAMGKT